MKRSCLSKICAVIGVAALASFPLSATTFTVTNTQDSGTGSFRQAIADANAGGGGDITFSNVTGVITLATNLPLITASVNILGPGTNALTVSGNNSNSIFQVSSNVSITLSGFTIANALTTTKMVAHGQGFAWVNYPGSAISNAGAMTIQNCVVSNCLVNTDGNRMTGGAIYSSGPLTMQNCLVAHCGSAISDSGLAGGAIASGGGLVLNNCCFSNCFASDVGGVIAGGPTNVFNNCLFVYVGADYSEGEGGAISGNNLTLNSCIISNCGDGWEGGGIIGANITVNNTVISECNGLQDAGGLMLSGTNYLYGCSITGCSAAGGFGAGGGGAGLMNYGNTTLLNCTVSGNWIESGGDGIGIWNAGTLNLTNCTISGNSFEYDPVAGGGIYNLSNAVVNLTDCTVVSNSASTGSGGGIFNVSGGTVNATDTIIANNSSNDFTGVLTSGGYNLIKNTTGCTLAGNLTGVLTGVDPKLGPLQNDGGFTMTHALLAGSPAIDAGPSNAPPYFDQRGLLRPHGAADDIGAFEYGAVPFPAVVSLAAAGANCFHVSLAGSPGISYTVLRAPSIAGPWTSIGSATTDCNGCSLCADTNAPPGNAFYRAAYQAP